MVFVAIIALVSSVCLIRFCVVRSHGASESPSLPLLSVDEITHIAEHADPATATHLGNVNMSLRRVSPLRLNKQYSAEYIRDPDFRARVNARRSNPRMQISLNLGHEFGRYLVNADYRGLFYGLVSEPNTQVWSDVQSLSLFGMELEDISPLVRLPYLEELDLGMTRMRDMSPLARLKNLQLLDLSRTQLQNLDAIGGLTNLRWLNLRSAQVGDISALAGLKNLQRLYLDNTPVPSLSAIAGLTHLQVLTVIGTVVDLREVAHLTRLFIIQ